MGRRGFAKRKQLRRTAKSQAHVLKGHGCAASSSPSRQGLPLALRAHPRSSAATSSTKHDPATTKEGASNQAGLTHRQFKIGSKSVPGPRDPSRGPTAPAFRAGCSRGDEEAPRRPTTSVSNGPPLSLALAGPRDREYGPARVFDPLGYLGRPEEGRLRHRQLAFGGPPRRHGCTQREKRASLDPGVRGPILSRCSVSSVSSRPPPIFIPGRFL